MKHRRALLPRHSACRASAYRIWAMTGDSAICIALGDGICAEHMAAPCTSPCLRAITNLRVMSDGECMYITVHTDNKANGAHIGAVTTDVRAKFIWAGYMRMTAQRIPAYIKYGKVHVHMAAQTDAACTRQKYFDPAALCRRVCACVRSGGHGVYPHVPDSGTPLCLCVACLTYAARKPRMSDSRPST